MSHVKRVQDEFIQALETAKNQIGPSNLVDVISDGIQVTPAIVMKLLDFKPSYMIIHFACIAFSVSDEMIDPQEFPRLLKALNDIEDEDKTPLRTLPSVKMCIRDKLMALRELRNMMFDDTIRSNFKRYQITPQPSVSSTPQVVSNGKVVNWGGR